MSYRWTVEQRYACKHEFDCMVCKEPIVEQYFPDDCLCCDCIDKGYDSRFENGQPVVIEPAPQPTSQWTVGDLAELVEMACFLECGMADIGVLAYCESCQVVPVTLGDKYCLGCAQDVTDYLALKHGEQIAVDGGLY
jgi:hypothetical protein